MDRRFTREQERLRERTLAFVRQEVPPEVARRFDREGAYPHGIMAKLAAQGFWASMLPKNTVGLAAASSNS